MSGMGTAPPCLSTPQAAAACLTLYCHVRSYMLVCTVALSGRLFRPVPDRLAQGSMHVPRLQGGCGMGGRE